MDSYRKRALENPDVFIAYASEDRGKAEAIRDYLKESSREEIVVFMDQDMPAGVRFREYLPEQLEKSKLVLVLWSKVFANKNFTLDEVDLALFKDKYFGLKLEELPKNKMYGANQYVPIDLVGWKIGDNGKLQRLLDDVVLKLEGKGRCFSFDSEGDDDDDNPYEEFEELLACIVDRRDFVSLADDLLLDDPSDWPILIVRGHSGNWFEAFANHLMMRQENPDCRHALSSETPELYRAVTVAASGSAKRYVTSLLGQVLPSESLPRLMTKAKKRALFNKWLKQEPELKVIYTAFSSDCSREEVEKHVVQVEELFQLISAANRKKYRVIVLFSHLNDQGLGVDGIEHIEMESGENSVKSKAQIIESHIEPWTQNIPAKLDDIYQRNSLQSQLKAHFNGEQETWQYDDLKQHILSALRNESRRKFGGKS